MSAIVASQRASATVAYLESHRTISGSSARLSSPSTGTSLLLLPLSDPIAPSWFTHRLAPAQTQRQWPASVHNARRRFCRIGHGDALVAGSPPLQVRHLNHDMGGDRRARQRPLDEAVFAPG